MVHSYKRQRTFSIGLRTSDALHTRRIYYPTTPSVKIPQLIYTELLHFFQFINYHTAVLCSPTLGCLFSPRSARQVDKRVVIQSVFLFCKVKFMVWQSVPSIRRHTVCRQTLLDQKTRYKDCQQKVHLQRSGRLYLFSIASNLFISQ